jgi:hypothetical protein
MPKEFLTEELITLNQFITQRAKFKLILNNREQIFFNRKILGEFLLKLSLVGK